MLAGHSHGKGNVCVLRLFRAKEKHMVRQFEVETDLRGPVDASFTNQDNSRVVATDTQKNTIFLLSQRLDRERSSREDFAILLARHFVSTYPVAVHSCSVRVTETLWERVKMDGKEHHHAFKRSSTFEGHALVEAEGPEGIITRIESGVRSLTVLKTTQSSFSNFVRDEYTLLPETNDRILATSIDATWEYDALGKGTSSIDFEATSSKVVSTIVETFAGPPDKGVASPSLQHTAFQIGSAVVRNVPAVANISLCCPNIHNIPVDFTPFPGRKNADETGKPDVFWATKEPFGIINVTVARPNTQSKARL